MERFAQTQYQAWQWMFLAGKQDVTNGDDLFPNSSTIGAFDYPYQVANKGKYLVNEINYTFAQPFHKLENIKPYISHSRFFKDENGYKDSERLIAGVYFNYKAIGIQGEYIMSKMIQWLVVGLMALHKVAVMIGINYFIFQSDIILKFKSDLLP